MTTVSASYSMPPEEISSLYEEISAVEEGLTDSPLSKVTLQGNIASLRRLVAGLGSSNKKFAEIQTLVRRALSDLQKPSAGHLEAKAIFHSALPRTSLRERLSGEDLSLGEVCFPEESVQPGQGMAYKGFKAVSPLVKQAFEHTKVGKILKYLQTVVKTWLSAEEHGIDEAGSDLIAGKILSKLCGGAVMGSADLAVFVAENEKELLAAADKIPLKFVDPAARADFASLSIDGPTPEGAKLLGQILIRLIAPIGSLARSVTEEMSHDVSRVMKAVGEHGEGPQADKAYGAMFAHMMRKE